MTEEKTDTMYDELAQWLSCERYDVKERVLSDSSAIDLTSITTAHEARKAFEKTCPESWERSAILMRWIGFAATINELDEIPLSPKEARNGPGRVNLHFYAKMVSLCETRGQLLRMVQAIRPGDMIWPMLVTKGLQILQKEKEVDTGEFK